MKMPPGGRTTSSAKFGVGEEVNSTIVRPTQSDAFTVLLPFPPSANRLVRHTRAGHYPSKAYTAWKKDADRFLEVQLANGLKLPTPPWAGAFVAETRLHPPDNRVRDLDNVGAKAIFDKITAWKIVEDDSQCIKLLSFWDRESLSPGTAMVTIWEASS